MWRIIHIFDGDYGCEERPEDCGPMVSLTLENESGERKLVNADDEWLKKAGLKEGSPWPENNENS